MKLFFYGHRKVSQPEYPEVQDFDFLQTIRKEMLSMLNSFGFQGLSAPQVGIDLQYIIVKRENGSILEIANPAISEMYGVESVQIENCISCPPRENLCKVPRMQTVHVYGRDPYDTPLGVQLSGKDARIAQHEIDHLSGTFYFDRATLKDRENVLYSFSRWKRQWKSAGKPFPYKGASHGNSTSAKTEEVDPRTVPA